MSKFRQRLKAELFFAVFGPAILTHASALNAGHAQGAAYAQGAADAQNAGQGAVGTADREQLPTGVRPVQYDLTLHPNAERRVFRGQVRIDIQVAAAASALELNAKDLVFDGVQLEDGRKAAVTLDPKLERATLIFAGGVAAGAHSLVIRYHGAIARGTLGFFAMDYQSPQGKRRTLATNFEPASERRFMPSWDEPGLKAKFRITVDVPRDRMALNNMPVESVTPLPKGMMRVRFAQTPDMSTYLLFLGIGDYERITETVDGVQVGVVVARGDTDRGRYALGEAARLLHYDDEYFGVRFPLPKLDLIAAPGQIEGGSMENWGAIFYSQDHLLFDPAKSSEADRQRVFLVVSHEMSHQWFGDLVTMSWWDNLWLNEGFARWMQTKAADDLHPQWKTGLQASSIVEQGMRADAKPSTHAIEQPVKSAAEAELAFDEITYDKGATVIGMLENYVGADRFRDGVRIYMHDHAFGNTVSADLWRALESAGGAAVTRIAEDFTHRPGLPLVSVGNERLESGVARVELSQDRFFEAHEPRDTATGEAPWALPLTIASLTGPSTTMLLDGTDGVASFGDSVPAIANAGRNSYARVRYAPAVFGALAARFGSLAPPDQIAMLQDAWALGESQYAPLANLLQLVQVLPLDADPIVWSKGIAILVVVDRLYAGLPGRVPYREWARARLAPLVARTGWDPAPGENPQVSLLREPLLLAMSRFGDANVIAEARRRYAASDGRRLVRMIVAANADPATFAGLVDSLRAARDPLEKQQLLEDLARTADPALVERVLDLIIGPETPAGSMPNLIARVGLDHPDLAWTFAVSHVDAPNFPLDRSTRMSLLPEIPSNSADPQRAAELRAYAASHLPAAAARNVQAAIAQIDLNARVRTVGLPQIDRWLLATH